MSCSLDAMYRVDRLASYLGGIEIEIADCMHGFTLLALTLYISHQYPSTVYLSRGWIIHESHIIVSHALSSSTLSCLRASSLLEVSLEVSLEVTWINPLM